MKKLSNEKSIKLIYINTLVSIISHAKQVGYRFACETNGSAHGQA